MMCGWCDHSSSSSFNQTFPEHYGGINDVVYFYLKKVPLSQVYNLVIGETSAFD